MEGRSPPMRNACLPWINARKFNLSHDPCYSNVTRIMRCHWETPRMKSDLDSECSEEPEDLTIPVTPPTIRSDCINGLQGLKKLQKLVSVNRSEGVGKKLFISCFEGNTGSKDCELDPHATNLRPPNPVFTPLGRTHAYGAEECADLPTQVSHDLSRGIGVLCCSKLAADCEEASIVGFQTSPLPYRNVLPMRPKDVVRGMKTLVLNLNGTLIHASLKEMDRFDFTIPAWINERLCEVFVAKRPGVEQFLATVARMYEVVVFTACPQQYTDLVLDILDNKTKCIRYRLYEDACIRTEVGDWAKDLSVLGRDLTKVITVDSKPNTYRLQPANSLQVGKFTGDRTDRELDNLLIELQLVWRLNV